jgi:hypothetical protein
MSWGGARMVRTRVNRGMTRGASGAATDVSGRTALSGAVEPANASVGEPPRQPESRELG